jgi:hypothetical protein
MERDRANPVLADQLSLFLGSAAHCDPYVFQIACNIDCTVKSGDTEFRGKFLYGKACGWQLLPDVTPQEKRYHQIPTTKLDDAKPYDQAAGICLQQAYRTFPTCFNAKEGLFRQVPSPK